MAGTLEDPIIEDLTHIIPEEREGYRMGKVAVIRVSKKGVVKKVIYNRQYKVKTNVVCNGRSDISKQLRGCEDPELIIKIKAMIEESKNKAVGE